MKKATLAALIAVGIALGSTGIANAAPKTQCEQAKTAIANLRILAANTTDSRIKAAYVNIADANERVVKSMCP